MNKYCGKVSKPSEIPPSLCKENSTCHQPPQQKTDIIGSGQLIQYIPNPVTCPFPIEPCGFNVPCPPLFTTTLVINTCTCTDFVQYNKINFINGDLYITVTPSVVPTTPINLLDIFPNLIGINGSLFITGTNYAVITGFEQLKWIEGDLMINNNPYLIEIPHFDALVFVGSSMNNYNVNASDLWISKRGRIIVTDNNLLRKVEGFRKLKAVSMGVFIHNNSCLTAIIGFCALTELLILLIQNNSKLCLIDGFKRLDSVAEMYINYNNHIGHSHLKIVGFCHLNFIGNLEIISNPGLIEVLFNSVCDFTSLFIDCNDDLEVIMFKSAKSGLNIEIGHNDNLSIILFDFLTNLRGSLVILNNSQLMMIETFNSLVRVGRVIRIEANDSLKYIEGFKSMKSVGQYTSGGTGIVKSDCVIGPVTTAPSAIIDCVIGTFTSSLCHPQTSTTTCGSDTCFSTFIEQSVITPRHICLELPYQLEIDLCNTDTCGSITVSPTSGIINARVSYSILIYNNSLLKTIKGFDSVDYISANLMIVQNVNLETIYGFGVMKECLDITIKNNKKMKEIVAFGSLRWARFIVIVDAYCLDVLNGFKSLKTAQTIDIDSKLPLSHINVPVFTVKGVNYVN